MHENRWSSDRTTHIFFFFICFSAEETEYIYGTHTHTHIALSTSHRQAVTFNVLSGSSFYFWCAKKRSDRKKKSPCEGLWPHWVNGKLWSKEDEKCHSRPEHRMKEGETAFVVCLIGRSICSCSTSFSSSWNDWYFRIVFFFWFFSHEMPDHANRFGYLSQMAKHLQPVSFTRGVRCVHYISFLSSYGCILRMHTQTNISTSSKLSRWHAHTHRIIISR